MWFVFQSAVAMATFAAIYPGNAGLGIAPAAVAMFAALAASVLLAKLIDWFRFPRGSGLRGKAERKRTGLIGVDRHTGDSPQPPSSVRIGQQIRKLI